MIFPSKILLVSLAFAGSIAAAPTYKRNCPAKSSVNDTTGGQKAVVQDTQLTSSSTIIVASSTTTSSSMSTQATPTDMNTATTASVPSTPITTDNSTLVNIAVAAPAAPGMLKPFNTKRGLGAPFNFVAADFNLFPTKKIGWGFDWEWYNNGFPSSLQFVIQTRLYNDIPGIANSYKNSKSIPVAFGLNEPDNAGQANVLPGDAAGPWLQYMNPLVGQGVQLVSPFITNSGAPGQGIDWLNQFNAACKNQCKYDAVGMHWYGGSFDDFKAQIIRVHTAFGKQVIVSEFALGGGGNSVADNTAFMKQAINFMDTSDLVHSYAWFGAFRGTDSNCLIDNNGALTALGQLYISL